MAGASRRNCTAGFFAGSELIAVQEDHPPHDFAGSDMEPDAGAVTEWPRRIGEMLQYSIQHERRGKLSRVAESITPLQLYLVDALEINRRALARYRLRHTRIMHLQATDFGFDPFGIDLDAIFDSNRARKECSRDHRPKATNRKNAINGEAKFPL